MGSSGAVDLIGRVRENVSNMYTDSSGVVARQWAVEVLLWCLHMCGGLKPLARLQDCIGNTARLFFADEGESLAEDLEAGRVPLPSIDIMRVARLRLDLCNVLFMRFIAFAFRALRFLLFDSSP